MISLRLCPKPEGDAAREGILRELMEKRGSLMRGGDLISYLREKDELTKKTGVNTVKVPGPASSEAGHFLFKMTFWNTQLINKGYWQ